MKVRRAVASVVNHLLRPINLELRWRGDVGVAPAAPKPSLATPNLDLIGVALAYYVAARPGANYVQIGAGDGYHGDAAVRELLPIGRLRAVLVEPLPDSFEKLQQRYAGVPNVSTVQAAIGMQNGLMQLFRARNAGRWLDSTAAPQFTSFSREHLLKHGIAEEEIESLTVPTLTLQELLDRFALARLDILKVDAEGLDAAIVAMALRLDPSPDCIYFENLHLPIGQAHELFDELSRVGYVYAHDKWNTLALHERLIQSWGRELR